MRVPNQLGDYPTMKLSQEELARYAREADQRVVQAESAAQRATSRPGPPSEYPEISVEIAEAGLEGLESDLFSTAPPPAPPVSTVPAGANLVSPPPDSGLPSPEAEAPAEDRASDVRDVRLALSANEGAHERVTERAAAEGPLLTSVPCVVASKEDLSWFELEETAHVVLALIDGESTVDTIVSTLSIPRATAVGILRELGAHGVIEFH